MSLRHDEAMMAYSLGRRGVKASVATTEASASPRSVKISCTLRYAAPLQSVAS